MSQDIRQDTPLLAVRGLDVDIAGESGMTHAVKRLQLAISQRETFALVGESGCGKSMTALALLRLLPDAGRIVGGQIDLDGEDLNRLPESAMRGVRGGRIGIIFQEPSTSLNPVMRVGDQIIETLVAHTPLRGAAARARAIDWLRRVGIPEPERRVDDYPFQFSGGQKQRVMIAIALAAEPLLLIADEPTTALDVTVQAQVLALLADIQREIGMAVLLITHDLAVVRNVAHHVALMRGGEIVESASAEEFFRAPKHPYARQLFDAIPTFEKRGVPLSEAGRAALGADAAVARKRAREPGVVLDVQDLKVHYPVRKGPLRRVASWVKAVDGVTFSLRAGETLALLGESGCGKTTTGKALLRLIDGARISGRAMLQGQDLLTADRARLQRLRQDIQIVFQDPYRSLNPRRTVGESIIEGLLNFGVPRDKAEQRAGETLSVVGLSPDAMRRYPHQFSGGQRQRICIARALVMDPEILVADEAVSALDVSVQAQVLELLEQVRQRTGVGVLFITHDLRVAAQICDTIMVMQRGKVVETGAAQAVLTDPRHEYTRALIDAAPGRDWDFRNFRPVAAGLASPAA